MRKRTIVLLGSGLLLVTILAATPRLLPWVLSRYRPDIRFIVATKERRIFITIDDAPSGNTSEILQVLRKHDAPATFFVIADRLKSPAQLQAIIAAGHTIGNHLRTTKACSKLSLAEFQSDFDACAALLEQAQAVQLFRPASDFGREEQIVYARSKGYQTVVGSVFPLDHWISDARLLVWLARWLSVSGGILILHDGDTRGHTTAAVLDRLLPQLRAEGYSFGRLEEIATTSARVVTRRRSFAK